MYCCEFLKDIKNNFAVFLIQVSCGSSPKNWNSLLDLIPDNLAGQKFNDKFNLLRKRKLVVTNRPKISEGTVSFRGIPQGSPMSAVLSNIYLIDFDQKLYELGKKMSFSYRRYCDDLLIDYM